MRMAAVVGLGLVLAAGMARGQVGDEGAIRPGQPWATVDGRPIQAHSGGMIRVGRTWYWIGENKTHGAEFYANSCYSSTDLVHWKFVNDTLKMQAEGDLGPHRIVERPKILYNAKTRTYVQYMHIDDLKYQEAKVGVATSRTVCGDYAYQGSFRPLGFESRDLGLFEDRDGKAYLLTEDRRNGLRVDLLSRDYLRVEKAVAVLPDMEAPAMVEAGGRYYLFSSHLTGWDTNDNEVTMASAPAGPWGPMKRFAPEGSKTFDSQTTFVLPVRGKSGTTYVYMGDRWKPKELANSTYIWLPLRIDGDSVWMEWRDNWTLGAGTGK